MPTELIVGVALTSLAAIGGGTAKLVKYAVSQGIDQAVNGQIKRVEQKLTEVQIQLGRVTDWTDVHDRTHLALLAALERQGIDRPDGL